MPGVSAILVSGALMDQSQLYAFVSLSEWELSGHGPVFTVANPRQCQDFSHLIGSLVTVDGDEYHVIDVLRDTHATPWREEELIGLLVSPVLRSPEGRVDG